MNFQSNCLYLSIQFTDVVVGHVGNSCLFFEKMLAEEGDTIDSWDSNIPFQPNSSLHERYPDIGSSMFWKQFIFRHCPNYIYPPPAPNSGKVVLLFGCQKVHWGAYHRVKFPWWWQLWKWWLWRVPQSTSNKKFVQTHASEKIYCL